MKWLKERKWYIGALVPAVYSALRFSLLYPVFSTAWERMDAAPVDTFGSVSLCLGLLVLIVSGRAVYASFKEILKDCEDPGKRFDYKFLRLPLPFLFKGGFDIYAAAKWETDTFDLTRAIYELQGRDLPGHAAGILSIAAMLWAAFLVLLCLILSVKMHRRYKAQLKAVE